MNLPPGVIRTPAGVYVLEKDTHLSRWIEEHGRLDIAEGEIMEGWGKYIPVGGVVVDAGASLGDHAATYAKLVGTGGMVYAFEPNPVTFAALDLNFRGVRQVSARNLALCNETGYGSVLPSDNIGASIFTPGHGDINCIALDHTIALFDRLDFIHLDCEGGEVDALNGAREVITKFRPVMVIEVNKGCLARVGKSEADLRAVLGELVYNVRELGEGHGPHMEQRDILCLP